jgi:hypothetical protein
MWVMSYTESRHRRGHEPAVSVGHRVTDEHPLVAVDRWNRRKAGEAAAGAGEGGTVVLTWYAPLSETERASLAAAGIDLTAVGVSVPTR